MEILDTQDFNFTHRSDLLGVVVSLGEVQRLYNRLLLARARNSKLERFLPVSRSYYVGNAVSRPFVRPTACRLTGGVVRGIVDPKEDPDDEYDD